MVIPSQRIGKNGPEVSRIALGCMRMSCGWQPDQGHTKNVDDAIAAFDAARASGITFFDNADIYGGTGCESIFGECLRAVPGSREKIVIATKCGIRSSNYNLTPEYIKAAVDSALKRLGTDYIDIFQMHRPDPLTHPRDTAAGLRSVVKSGLVRHVGVSNYYPEQVRALQTYLEDLPIVSNQISISLNRLDPIYEGWDGGDGVLDQCMALGMTPLAYSPLGGGWISGRREIPGDHAQKQKLERILAELSVQAEKHNAKPGQIAVAWLLAHPSGIVPLIGSNNPEHIREAAEATKVQLSREDWYALWMAAWGRRIP
jgi:predicted oxidoreductase